MRVSRTTGINDPLKIVSGSYTDIVSTSRFQAMIGAQLRETIGKEIQLPNDMCKSAFDSFVRYCWGEKPEITLENAYDLGRAAKQWKMHGLREEVASFMDEHANDFIVVRIIEEIEQHGEDDNDEIDRLESQLRETIEYQVKSPVFLAYATKLGLPRLLRVFHGKEEKVKGKAAQFVSNCVRAFGDDAFELLGTEGELEVSDVLLGMQTPRPDRVQSYRFLKYVPLSMRGLVTTWLILSVLVVLLCAVLVTDKLLWHRWIGQKIEQVLQGRDPEPEL